ncbi:F-box/LRR-repeat protein 6-like [Amphibalanus amphitrite]|uniref:F-box/LRR-repeat protein 6-like n=1 Tax=Amphibalanus amphitrite TaxID=1232801 RepID=UPI001C909272|nr:F-box/LRR-repeat protein 6-like [Amphibalanus amphitrite]
MDPGADERSAFPSFELVERLDSPSSNERNTNTLCSSSESDVMKTPSAGGDTPSAGGDSPAGFCPTPGTPAAESRAPLPPPGPGVSPPSAAAGSPPAAVTASPPAMVTASPSAATAAAVPPVVAAGLGSPPLGAPSPPAPGVLPPRVLEDQDAIAASPHRAPACDCLMCDATFHPRLGEGLRRRSGSGRGARTTYHSQISPDAGSIKLKIRVQTLDPADDVSPGSRRRRRTDSGGAPRGKRRRRWRRSRLSDDEDEEDLAAAPVRRRRSKSSSLAAEEEEDPDRPQGPWADGVPPELLERIFGEVVRATGAVPALVRLSRVCRSWRRVALLPELWRTVDLATGLIRDKMRHERLLIWLAENRLSKTEELSLAGWSSALSPRSVPVLVSRAPQLRSLCLSGCRSLTGEEVVQLAGLQHLSSLDLSDLQANTTSARAAVGPHPLQQLSSLLGPRLVSLTLSHNFVAGMQQILAALAEHCPNLEVLDLSNITNAIRDIVPVRVERLQEGCPRLRVLRWTNTELRLADTPLKEQMSSQGFPALEELSVAVPRDRHWGLDDAGVERLLKASNQLRLLDVRGCQRLSDSSLVRVPAWNLQHLFLSGCDATRSSADRLELVVRKWRHSLLELDLSGAANQQALDAALLALAERPDPGQPPTPLRKLDLCGAAGTFGPVCRLVAACAELRELNLTSCRALPRGVKRVYRGPELEALRRDIAAGKFNEQASEEAG